MVFNIRDLVIDLITSFYLVLVTFDLTRHNKAQNF